MAAAGLPVKLPGGRLALRRRGKRDREEDADREDADREPPPPAPPAPAPPAPVDAAPADAAPVDVAALCVRILENPESGVRSDLDSLLSLAEGEVKRSAGFRCLASLSLVFRDICPGYQIRSVGEDGGGPRLSREVAALRDHEARLLRCYRRYLLLLRSAMSRSASRRAAAQCCAALLPALAHFNYANEAVAMLVPALDCADASARAAALESLGELVGSRREDHAPGRLAAVSGVARGVAGALPSHAEPVLLMHRVSVDAELGRAQAAAVRAARDGTAGGGRDRGALRRRHR